MRKALSAKPIDVRAARLRREAVNCLDIAVRERDATHAAALIDEAARLARRAAELAG